MNTKIDTRLSFLSVLVVFSPSPLSIGTYFQVQFKGDIYYYNFDQNQARRLTDCSANEEKVSTRRKQ